MAEAAAAEEQMSVRHKKERKDLQGTISTQLQQLFTI